MGFTQQVWVDCDHFACSRYLVSDGPSIAVARQLAEKRGYASAGVKVFCPTHASDAEVAVG